MTDSRARCARFKRGPDEPHVLAAGIASGSAQKVEHASADQTAGGGCRSSVWTCATPTTPCSSCPVSTRSWLGACPPPIGTLRRREPPCIPMDGLSARGRRDPRPPEARAVQRPPRTCAGRCPGLVRRAMHLVDPSSTGTVRTVRDKAAGRHRWPPWRLPRQHRIMSPQGPSWTSARCCP